MTRRGHPVKRGRADLPNANQTPEYVRSCLISPRLYHPSQLGPCVSLWKPIVSAFASLSRSASRRKATPWCFIHSRRLGSTKVGMPRRCECHCRAVVLILLPFVRPYVCNTPSDVLSRPLKPAALAGGGDGHVEDALADAQVAADPLLDLGVVVANLLGLETGR